ncbi:MAG: hypothetical protein AAGF75_02880 [Cyanobacteria bacterium P01_H01_bin.130]
MPGVLTQWWFWMVTGCAGIGGVIAIAVIVLLQVPALPTCPSVFWPLASGSVRIYCAELSAKKRTPEDLLDAIMLLDGLDEDDGLRPLANEYLIKWTEELLTLTEAVVNAGDLDRAIALVQEIPDNDTTRELLQEKVQEWRTEWSEAETLHGDALAAMEQQRWSEAQIFLRRLRGVQNPYWSSEKHGELTLRMKALLEDSSKIRRAQRLAKGRSQSGYQQALELLASIRPSSPLYQDAQIAQEEIADQLLAKARQELEGGNGTGALALANLLPDTQDYGTERFDLRVLAQAIAAANRGTGVDLELAITEASKITSDRPLYDRAQRLIARWQRDTEFVGYLERARQIAARGTANDYTDAIAQAKRIPESSGQYEEARRQISLWSDEWQRLRDRPRLDQARDIARSGSINALQSAIATASKIPSSSPLSEDARADAQQWQEQIERRQDQPTLTRAQNFANSRNWSQAVQVAQSLANSDRALSSQAQRLIGQWQREQNAQRNWQTARSAAASNTVDGLLQALAVAQRVNNGTRVYSAARRAMDTWSRQVVTLARQRGAFDSTTAIAWLQKIPQGTSGYAIAQSQIQQWRSQNQPKPKPDPAIQQPFIIETPPPNPSSEVSL